MSRRRSSSIRVGRGGTCQTCSAIMDRYEHQAGFAPRPGQPYHFKYWDRCGCGHLQHYEDAKVYAIEPNRPQRQMTPEQIRASRALKDRWPATSSKRRRQWLASEMGIEERFAIIGDMDAVECATVIEICAEPTRKGAKAA